MLSLFHIAQGYHLPLHVPATHAPRAHVVASTAVSTASPLVEDIWTKSPVRVEGQTLKTWDIGSESINRVQLAMKSDGRPIETNVELWHTPAYIPTKFHIWTEDGQVRPVDAVIETPKNPKTVAVFNIGPMEWPFTAVVADTGLAKAAESLSEFEPELVQGGALKSYSFGSDVESVQVLLNTDALGQRNMKAKIEITQGPNEVKQIIELYASVGYKNPFYAVLQTPGAIKTVRIINQNTVEFPLNAVITPYKYGDAGAAVELGGF